MKSQRYKEHTITESAGKEKPTTTDTLPSKACPQIQQRNQKLYREAKAKRIQHHQTSFKTKAKRTSLGREQGATTRNKNYESES